MFGSVRGVPCAECRAREGCNDMFKDRYACRELKRKEKKDAGNKR